MQYAVAIKEAIILAGGLGTRLRSVVPDQPKCMAMVAGHPFIYYIVRSLEKQGIERFIFSLGYKHEAFTDFLAQLLPAGNYSLCIEKEPLGTGGAVRFALKEAQTPDVLVVNGDTLFLGDLALLFQVHKESRALCTLSLKPMKNADRYGSVIVDSSRRIVSFKEKMFCPESLINVGFTLVRNDIFAKRIYPEKFSMETDFLELESSRGTLFACVQDGYFIDIGIPADFYRANEELKKIDESF